MTRMIPDFQAPGFAIWQKFGWMSKIARRKPVFIPESSMATQEGGGSMYTHPGQSLVYLVFGVVLVSILFSPLVASSVRADVGVQPILPGGSNLKPDVETPVEMQAEKVILTVRKATEADNAVVKLNPEAYGLQFEPVWFPAIAEVQADFTMKNPTSEAVNMAVWFPLASALESVEWELNPEEIVPRIEGFQVKVDGNTVDSSVSEWPNPKGEDKLPLPWASFPVTFPAGKETIIQVSYIVPAQRTEDGVGMRFDYVFQTGAGWAGPIGKAELVVNLPYPASAETIGAMPAGGHTEGQQVNWTWENLEPGPQDDFSIWLLLPDHWDELQAVRAAVAANPKDGEAWLNLASIYRRLMFGKYRVLPGFGETYLPLGVQAAQEALRLLPGDGRPHYELAMFYLLALPQNPSPEALQPMLDELKFVDELSPGLTYNIHDMFEFLINNDPMAEWVSWSDYWATATATAARKLTPSKMPTQQSTPSSTPIPSTTTPTQNPTQPATPIPPATLQSLRSASQTLALPTPTVIQRGSKTGGGQGLVIIIAAGIIGLVIVGYLALKRMRGNVSK
jgi:hypothetical protein